MMKRPLATVALVYGGGLLLADWCPLPLAFVFALSWAVLVAAVCWAGARRWLLWPLVLLVGWTNLACRTAILSPHDLRLTQGESAEIVTVRGRLIATPDQRIHIQDGQEAARSLAQLEVNQILRQGKDWQPAFGRILVLTRGVLPPEFFAKQKVEIAGVLSPPPGPKAEGLFDYRGYLRRQGIYFQLKADGPGDWTKLRPLLPPPLADRFLAWAQSSLALGLPGEDEPLQLLWAMTLGWKTGLTNEIYEPFMQSGTMHIFAISGLHIAFIAGILVHLLRVLRVSRAWCGVIIVPLIWFYTGVTGWQPSAIRSTVMMSIIIAGWALKRPTDLLNSLAAAAFIILLWDPQQLFGASFQLSFFVVLSIALLLPPLECTRDRLLNPDPLLPAHLVSGWRRWLRTPLRWVTGSVATSLAAWLGSLPITAWYFHLFSPVTLLANLVIVPLSSAGLACNLGSLVCAGWAPWAAVLFNHSAWFWMNTMVQLSHWFTQWPLAYWYIPAPSTVTLIVYYVLLLGILSGWLLVPERRRWTFAALAGLTLAYFVVPQFVQRPVELTILPQNGGLCVFANDNGQDGRLLVDCGTTNTVEFVLKPFLHAQGINRLPNMVLTHGDFRHVGGAELAGPLLGVQQVMASSLKFRSPVYRQLTRHFEQSPGFLRAVHRADQIGRWTVLHPARDDRFARADDGCLVLHGTINRTRILLVSDLGRQGQETLIKRSTDLWADVLITGLPSDGDAACDSFLDAVRPQLIIVADSEFPAVERAPVALRSRLQHRGIPVVYTRDVGTTTLVLHNNRWDLRMMNPERAATDASPIGPPATLPETSPIE